MHANYQLILLFHLKVIRFQTKSTQKVALLHDGFKSIIFECLYMVRKQFFRTTS